MLDLAILKDIAPIIGAAIGLITLMFGVYQYSIAQIWKRNEFLAKEMKDFLGDDKIKEAFRFFDYWGSNFAVKIEGHDRNIRIFHSEKQLKIANAMQDKNCVLLTLALKSGDGSLFTSEEQMVRDYIDHFMSSLERICAFRENRLFRRREMMPFIQYYVDTFNGLKSHSQGYHDDLFNFLYYYKYTLTLKLLDEFPKSKEVKLAIQKASRGRKRRYRLIRTRGT